MLESSLAELDASRGKAQRHAESLAFVEETLASYEEENRSLLEELNLLKDTYKKSSGNLDDEVKELRVRSATLEEQVKGLATEAETNKAEVRQMGWGKLGVLTTGVVGGLVKTAGAGRNSRGTTTPARQASFAIGS
jgi:chromosome segregation ATPase